MKKLFFFALLSLLCAATLVSAAPIRSGPQPGDKVPGPFRPLHVNGPEARQRVCLYCKYGAKPVAMIFAREWSPALGSLVIKIEAAVAARTETQPGSFAVFLGDEEKWVPPLAQVASHWALNKTILTVMGSAPASYDIANDAAVTVILYSQRTVRANHAFRTGELDDKAISAILADLAKMLPAK